MHGFGLLLGHLIGDFVFQNDWQAREKVKSSWACAVHCTLYTLAVLLCTFWWLPWWLYLVVWLTHFPVDRWRLARPLMEKVLGQQMFVEKMSPWSVIVVDNTVHLLVLFACGLVAELVGPPAPTQVVMFLVLLCAVSQITVLILLSLLARRLLVSGPHASTGLKQARSFTYLEEGQRLAEEQKFQVEQQAQLQVQMDQHEHFGIDLGNHLIAGETQTHDASHYGFVVDVPLQPDGRHRIVVSYEPGDTLNKIVTKLMLILTWLDNITDQDRINIRLNLVNRLGTNFDSLSFDKKFALLDRLQKPAEMLAQLTRRPLPPTTNV